MSQSDEILALLRERPNLKAQDIAHALGMDRSAVNSFLYGQLSSRVVQDNAYRWQLVATAGAERRQEPENSQGADTSLAQLCRYYLDCLFYDEDNGVSLFASSRYDLDYFDPGLSSLEETLASGLQREGIQPLLRRLNRDRNRNTLVLGYPLRLRLASGRSGWSGYMVEPVMLFTLRGSLRDTAMSTFEALPTVNFAHLRHFAVGGNADLMREAIQLTDDLGLANEMAALPELDELFSRLHAVRPEWDWQESPDVDALSSGTKIAGLKAQGIYNRAIICGIERSPYTVGLETELQSLTKLSEDAYDGTAIRSWLTGELQTRAVSTETALLEPLPLNAEQRMAIEYALSRPLTVITGPPGTGKSQVVTALLMNAAWNGERVLFASKNNKAVDVVEERVNSFGSRPIMLRLGNDEHRRALASHLSSMLGARATGEDRDSYQRHVDIHQSLAQERTSQAQRVERIVSLRNQTDHLEQSVERMRHMAGERGLEAVRDVSAVELQRVRGAALRLQDALRRAHRNSQPFMERLVWFLLRHEREKELVLANQEFRAAIERVQLHEIIQAPGTDSAARLGEFAQEVADLADACQNVNEYFSSLTALQREDSLEEVARNQIRLAEVMADNSQGLWQAWLHIQPDSLRAEDRQAIGEYSAVLELIVGANQENKRVEGRMLRKYYDLFPKVADVLPCWAVTSLSARGRLPLQAGTFDLLVIDEASQCDIASALPLLYRSKRAVIIGDPQQLRHISALRPNKDQQLLVQHGLDAKFLSWSYSAHSLFDLASSLCNSEDIVALRDHHRSHSDIIEFSNEHFYEGRLRVATNYSQLRASVTGEPAIHWVDIKGHAARPAAGGAVNEQEAQAVVAELMRLLQQGYQGSIGVVSPFRAQVNRVRDVLAREGDALQRLIANDCLIDTVHRFQGDERDLIIFSPVVAQGISTNSLGFLSGNGNLFNVAITRARSALVVVGDRATAASCGVEYLERFVNYVDGLARGKHTLEDAQALAFGPEYPTLSRPERVSDWERYFYKVLYQAGHRPIPQYTVDQYDLDFALLPTGDRKLNIEVDGERYHRDWDGELCRRDQIRNQRLMEMGWDVMRFWVYEIRDDLEGCISRVDAWVAEHATALIR